MWWLVNIIITTRCHIFTVVSLLQTRLVPCTPRLLLSRDRRLHPLKALATSSSTCCWSTQRVCGMGRSQPRTPPSGRGVWSTLTSFVNSFATSEVCVCTSHSSLMCVHAHVVSRPLQNTSRTLSRLMFIRWSTLSWNGSRTFIPRPTLQPSRVS